MNAPRGRSYEASLLQGLKDPEEAAAYLDAGMELEDPSTLLLALRQVAKAHAWPKWPAAPMWATRPCFAR